MHPNEISRKTLAHLYNEKPNGARFSEMADLLKIDERSLSKNLFWLEEHNMVKLSTSLSSDSTFPKIILIKLTGEGKSTAKDKDKLEQKFPIYEHAQTHTYAYYLQLLRDEINWAKNISEEEKNKAFHAIETLIATPVSKKEIK